MLLNGSVSLVLCREENEGVSRGPTVGVVDEQNTILTVQHCHGIRISGKEF